MSDPLERLGETDTSATPDIGALKARARRIDRRRRVAVGASGAAVALISAVGIFLGSDPATTPRQVAQPDLSMETGTLEGRSSAEAQSPTSVVPGQEGEAAGATGQAGTGGAEAAQPMSADSAASGAEAGSALNATLQVDETATGRGVQFTLRVCNPNSEVVTSRFDDGQRYDFLVHRDGGLVWRWSDGQVFTQETGELRWKPEECRTWTEAWDGMRSSGTPAMPGTHEAVGVLTSSPEVQTPAETFCLDIC